MIGWPHQRCLYPRWIAERVWRDLDDRHSFRLDESGDVIRQYFRSGDVTSSAQHTEILKSFRCHRVLEQNSSADQFVAVAFVSNSW